MDALSKIFDDIHLNRAEYVYLQAQGEWRLQLQTQQAVVAHIVIHGSMHLHFEGQHLHAQAGDIVLFPSGVAHSASFSANAKLIETVDLAALFSGHRNEPILLGDAASRIQASTDKQSLLQDGAALDGTASSSTDTSGDGDKPNLLSLSFRCAIDTNMARPLLNALPKVMHIQALMTSRAPEWLQIGLMFVGIETQQILPGRDKIFDHLVSILFIECVRDYICSLPDQSNWLNALTHPELSSAMAAIHGQPQLAWTVESLAEQCCMSRSKFASVFHEVVGEPPLTYLQQHRLRLASQLLRDSNLSVQQIAHRVGYASDTAFSQVFKRQFELAPKQYRQAYLK